MAGTADVQSTISEPLLQCLWKAVRSSHWQRVILPPPSPATINHCRRLYADDGRDLALATLSGNRTFALIASCPHAGGPLDQGDIEDLGERQLLYCPVHMYGFDLTTGLHSSGLQAEVFTVKQVEEAIFVNTPSRLALKSAVWLLPPPPQQSKETESKLLQSIQEILDIRTVTGKIGKLHNLVSTLDKPEVLSSLTESKFYSVAPVARGKLRDFRRKTEAVRQLSMTAMELMQLVDRCLVVMAMLGAMSGKMPSLETTTAWLAKVLKELLEWLTEIHRIVEILPANLDELVHPPSKIAVLEKVPDNVPCHFLTTLAVSLMLSLARELEFLAARVPLVAEGGQDCKAVMGRVVQGLEGMLLSALSTFSSVSELAGIAQDPASTLKTVLTAFNKDYMELPFSVEEDKTKATTSWYQHLLQKTSKP